MGYYHIRAPFDGIVGDIPVHLGDYVSQTTVLTTVDENRDYEAYIYIPTERTSEVRNGLPVNIVDSNGNLLESTKINFVAPSVDNGLAGNSGEGTAEVGFGQVPDGPTGEGASESGVPRRRRLFRCWRLRGSAARHLSLSLEKTDKGYRGQAAGCGARRYGRQRVRGRFRDSSRERK